MTSPSAILALAEEHVNIEVKVLWVYYGILDMIFSPSYG